jgi:hypothetical protein
MARGQSQKLSARVLSELTSSSGEITIQQQESDSRNPAMDEQVRMSLTPQQKEIREKYTMYGKGYYDKKYFKSEIDTEIRKQQERTATPPLQVATYLYDNKNGSLKDILTIGDSLVISSREGNNKILVQRAYRVIGIKDKSIDIASIDENGTASDNRTITYKLATGNYQEFEKNNDYPLNLQYGKIKNFRRDLTQADEMRERTKRLIREGKIKLAGKGFDTGE